MAAAVTGSKTVATDVSPVLTAAALTTLFATAPENFTVANYRTLGYYLKAKIGGEELGAVIGPLFP